MNFNFTDNLELSMKWLHTQGAFLTVKDKDIVNTMTISWGNIGFEWQRPVFTALIRKSRYTHELIENSKEFTISIPVNSDMKGALTICGTKSGRNTDKFKEANLTLKESTSISTPVIDNCSIFYECKVVYSHDMCLENMNADIKQKFYGDNDIHTLYYGEIVNAYIIK